MEIKKKEVDPKIKYAILAVHLAVHRPSLVSLQS